MVSIAGMTDAKGITNSEGHPNQVVVSIIGMVVSISGLGGQDGSDYTSVEEFRLNPAKIPVHWFGSNVEERGNDIGNTYTVNMSGSKGQGITIVTGATYKYPLPMIDNRVITDGVTRLANNEDYYMYLNTSDYIANLVVILESSTTKLATIERGSFQQEANKPVQRKESFFGGKQNSKNEEISISSKWDNLRPGQSGGIIYSW